ncbi:MAG: rod shape-determining protein [Planctomycetota bacterium]|nr:MAG: rod shape-determining protein [Planctomycetota bacterium]
MGFIDRILGYFSTDLGIDLGTANTLVCIRNQGVVLSEPSVVAVYKGTNKIVMDGTAVGNKAKEMLGKTPGHITAIRPMKDGVIADFEITQAMLKYFIQKVHRRKWFTHPRVIIAVPSGITVVERRAVQDSAVKAGAREVNLIEEPMAAAIGVGLPVTSPEASMIVDIGGGTTEVAIISLAGIVTSESLRIAGDEMDEAIIQHMKRVYNLMIGERTSEAIKIDIGSASELETEISYSVRGRDLISGLPRQVAITSEEIRECLRDPIEAIIESIKMCLERTIPELAADLVDKGLVLVGGGALLKGLDVVISTSIGLPVYVGEDPLTAVARGTGIALEGWDNLRDISKT